MKEPAKQQEPRREDRRTDALIRPFRFVSPHVVDLSAFSPNAPKGPRARMRFWQKIAARLRGARMREQHRGLVPFMPHKKKPRASVIGFLKLPFALLALPFKRRPRPLKTKPTRPTPAAAPVPPRPAIPARQAPKPVTIRLSRKRRPVFSFFPDTAWKRHVLGFAALAVVVTVPLQALLSYAGLLRKAGVIAADAKQAVAHLANAGQAAVQSGTDASDAFQRSAGAFASTRERVDDLTVRLAALFSGNGEQLSSGTKLLEAGEAVSRAGAELATGMEAMRASQDTNAEKLALMQRALVAALPHLEEGIAKLKAVPARSVPTAYRNTFDRLREDAALALADVRRASGSFPALLDAIGANGKRRYLVVFQNANELRPTGGFIGSFALMDLEDGTIARMEIPSGGSYDVRSGFNQRLMAPDPLRLVNPRWEFQDANWFADFPTSARALTWFYEKSGGPTVDGVIAVTSGVMQALLQVTGPIEMPEYGRTITAENFQVETQKAVEIEYDRTTNQPKQIITDMAPKLLQRVVNGGSANLPVLAGALGKALATKDIQVYFRDEETQEAAQAFGWAGALRPLDGADYLAVIDTNIAGGKTDGVIEAQIRHATRFEEDGGIVDTVTVTRTHGGEAGELFTGTKNIDYMRVYVPGGSTLLSAEGFEAPAKKYFLPRDSTLQPSTLLAAVEGRTAIHGPSGTDMHEEGGLTVFGNWMQLEPGETKTVTLSYRLPFRLTEQIRQPASWLDWVKDAFGLSVPTADYRLVVQKQAGAVGRIFENRVGVPPGWTVRTRLPEEMKISPEGLTFRTPLQQDLYLGMVLTHDDASYGG